MADYALMAADTLRILESNRQSTFVAGEDLSAGDAVRYVPNSNGAGKVVKAQADTSANARVVGIAMQSVKSGYPVSVLMEGVVDGYDFGTADFGATAYLSGATAGKLADAAGAQSKKMGHIMPIAVTRIGKGYDRVLFLDVDPI